MLREILDLSTHQQKWWCCWLIFFGDGCSKIYHHNGGAADVGGEGVGSGGAEVHKYTRATSAIRCRTPLLAGLVSSIYIDQLETMIVITYLSSQGNVDGDQLFPPLPHPLRSPHLNPQLHPLLHLHEGPVRYRLSPPLSKLSLPGPGCSGPSTVASTTLSPT